VNQATELVAKLRSSPKIKPWDLERVEAIAYLAATNNSAAEETLKNAVKEDPTDTIRLSTLADFYRRIGIDALRHNKMEQGKADLNASLYNLDLGLKFLVAHHASDDVNYAPTLLKKAEVQMMLENYKDAIGTLNEVLQGQPDNATALLNRAIAEEQLKQLKAAKDDCTALRKLLPEQPYVVDFRLAEIASLEKNTPDEIHYLKRYLKSAPMEAKDYDIVAKRLQTLEGH
jgi:predicted Zn-dependent protease